MAPEIMSSFFSTAAELADRSREGSKQPAANPRAAGPADAAAAAEAKAEATSAALKDGGSTYATVEEGGGVIGSGSCQLAGTAGCGLTRASSSLKVSSSGKLSAAVVAAARAAVAAMPGSLCSGISSSMKDPDAEAQLESAPTYDGTKADVFSLGVLLVVIMLRRMPWNYDVYAERCVHRPYGEGWWLGMGVAGGTCCTA
jgi:hypothetical protein